MAKTPGPREHRKPKTALKGKRLHCAICRKRSPRKVLTPAPWYCPQCLRDKQRETAPLEGAQP